MVRVGERASGQIPGLVPAEVGLVEEEPHELGHGQSRMRVVHLDRHLLREDAPVAVGAAEAAHEIGERAGHEKVLLQEAQALPLDRGIVRVKHTRQRLRGEGLRERPHEVAAAELLEVEIIRRGGGPEPECVDGLAAIADDRAIERAGRAG